MTRIGGRERERQRGRNCQWPRRAKVVFGYEEIVRYLLNETRTPPRNSRGYSRTRRMALALKEKQEIRRHGRVVA